LFGSTAIVLVSAAAIAIIGYRPMAALMRHEAGLERLQVEALLRRLPDESGDTSNCLHHTRT